jgi:AmiR/NasT family two-component response regulator
MPRVHQPAEPIRVAVVADTSGPAQHIARTLQGSGYSVRPFSLTTPGAFDRVRELRPVVVVVRAGARNLPVAAAFARIAANGGPEVVLLTPAASSEALGLAFESGALVHVIEPVAAQALAAAVRVAAARAQDVRLLYHQLRELRESVQDRKAVERAKAILMERLGLSEEEAHRRLQRESRNRNRKLIDTAWHVIQADAQLSRTLGSAAKASAAAERGAPEVEPSGQERESAPVESTPSA